MLQLLLLRATAVAAAAAATFDVLMPRAAVDVSGQLTTAHARLTALAHACGCCTLAAGLIYDEGLYTVGLVPCTLADHLHHHCKGKDIECCLALCGL